MPPREIVTTPCTTTTITGRGPPATELFFADSDKGRVDFFGIVDEHGVPVTTPSLPTSNLPTAPPGVAAERSVA
jgi:hypothetical protein